MVDRKHRTVATGLDGFLDRCCRQSHAPTAVVMPRRRLMVGAVTGKRTICQLPEEEGFGRWEGPGVDCQWPTWPNSAAAAQQLGAWWLTWRGTI